MDAGAGIEKPDAVDDEEWEDWERATFAPLAATNPELEAQLRARAADRFLAAAGLSVSHRQEAMQQLCIDEGRTPRGVRILRVSLPLGEGRTECEWDGTAVTAEDHVDSIADVAGETIADDRATMGLSTGWEPEFDERLAIRPHGSHGAEGPAAGASGSEMEH